MSSLPESFGIALWATNLARPLNGIGAWVQSVEAKLAEAKAAGADILVMPEYIDEQWLSFAPENIEADEEIPWMAEQAAAALEGVAPLAEKHGIGLLAGSMAVPHPEAEAGTPPFRNRAFLFLPDGRRFHYDKLCLTPAEKNPAAWNLGVGSEVEVIEWRGLRMAMVICLDVELPALAAKLAPLQLDLLLVPSMTAKLAGHHRVFGCAKARAVELQSIVGVVGCIGAASTNKPRDTNVGGAAVFLPCEEPLGHEGLAGKVPAVDHADDEGPMLVVKDLPLKQVRALREGSAEVWPGAWTAEHIVIKEPAAAA